LASVTGLFQPGLVTQLLFGALAARQRTLLTIRRGEKMSGGHWEYQQFQAFGLLRSVAEDVDVAKRFPKLCEVLEKLTSQLDDVVHDLDYDLEGDSLIKNDEAFEKEAIEKLQKAVM